MQSEEIKNQQCSKEKLYAALAQAQADFKKVGKANEGFQRRKFADKDSLLNPQWPVLKANGLSVHERIEVRGDIEVIKVVLMHESGQEISTECVLRPEDRSYTKWAAAVTFQSRSLYRGILGIAICEDVEDDDGFHQQKAAYNKPLTNAEFISEDQLEQLNHELKDQVELAKQVMRGLGIDKLAHMPREKFLRSMDRIRELKTK